MDEQNVKRLRVLISAYACEPGKGSEPGVGWNVAKQMAKFHDVWVITRANNHSAIELEMSLNPCSTLHFAYYDLPVWARWWKKGTRGIQLYYYLWQIGIFFIGRRLHKEIRFEIIHHATFVRYWTPSFLSFLSVPFIWGPVGGGESAPKAFWKGFSLKGRMYERFRETARWLGEHDPFVRRTAKNSSLGLATTEDTAARLKSLGLKKVAIIGESSLAESEINQLESAPFSNGKSVRFISMSRLLHWKGIHLSLRAFAHANLPLAEYWIVGDGPERKRLEALTQELLISDRVFFWGLLSRHETIVKLKECHALVHPSLHDSGGWVCLESMTVGRPVICLNLGGPATQVTPETGIKILAVTPNQVVRDMSNAMLRLAKNPHLVAELGRAARERVTNDFSWEGKGRTFNAIYQGVVKASSSSA